MSRVSYRFMEVFIKRLYYAIVFIIGLTTNFVFSQTYVGQYAVQTKEGLLTLELQESGPAAFVGILNAGNTQGYVSVPGYGPVGYGF